MAANNVSSGIEPVFAHEVDRTVQEFNGPIQVTIPGYAYGTYGVSGKTADQVTVGEHLAVLLNAQRYVDSAVSKTLNVSPDTPWEDFKQIYVNAWMGGAKGCTTFQLNSKRIAVLKKAVKPIDQSATAVCYFDPVTGKKECE